jgi:hypothetical protein
MKLGLSQHRVGLCRSFCAIALDDLTVFPPQNQPLPRLLNLSLGIKPFPFRYQLRRAMQDHLEDAAILAGLGFSSCLLFGLLWLFLGPMGVAGTLAGYGLGLAIYLAPLPEQ